MKVEAHAQAGAIKGVFSSLVKIRSDIALIRKDHVLVDIDQSVDVESFLS